MAVASGILLWFRNDLRLHDHEALATAAREASRLLPVYCADPRLFDRSEYGFPRTAAFRARFLMESIEDLRRSLRQLGSDLVVRVGRPEDVLPRLTEQSGLDAVYAHGEIASEELSVEGGIREALGRTRRELRLFWGGTMLHPADLPFNPNTELPDVFTDFRKSIEPDLPVRKPISVPASLPPSPGLDPGTIPSIKMFGLKKPRKDSRRAIAFQGGEAAGFERLVGYFWTGNHLRRYKETRNGLLGESYSSKFSPWLAAGCLSPRFVYAQIREYEKRRARNESTYWLIFELLWRDYFRFAALRHGDNLFKPGGIQQTEPRGNRDKKHFDAWREGQTGIPFIDANMRELARTGYMSNRGRQNVASFLVRELGLDWRMGASWFESMLVDYDPCSNYGNWNYVAGVGNDPRGDRHFDILAQAHRYDPEGDYVREWVPELRGLDGNTIHAPWRLSDSRLDAVGVLLGETYPRPIVEMDRAGEAAR